MCFARSHMSTTAAPDARTMLMDIEEFFFLLLGTRLYDPCPYTEG
jgi:hypothetical protein